MNLLRRMRDRFGSSNPQFQSDSYVDEEVYELKNQRGRALILDNEKFRDNNQYRRVGNEADKQEIYSLLKTLKFADRDIIRLSNGTAQDMRNMLQRQSKDKELRKVDYFICFIMSHGRKGGKILGSDGNTVNLKYIEDLFNRESCPDLKGKPKIFFIQACRGEHPESDENHPSLETDSQRERKTLSIKADFLVAFACEEDYASFRETRAGSVFIQAVCAIFRQHWRRKSLLNMLTMVNKHMMEQVIPHERRDGVKMDCKQTSVFKSSLGKEFYFYRQGRFSISVKN